MKAALPVNRKWVGLFREGYRQALADGEAKHRTMMAVFREFCRSDDYVSSDIDRAYLTGYFEALFQSL